MSNTVDKVINIALAEVGYLEKSKQAYTKNPEVLDSKEDGAGSENYTKYGRDMNKLYPSVIEFPAPWCDCFVDWCFYKAYEEANAKALLGGNFDDYTVNSAQLYKNKKAWYTSNPKVGDQIFFKYNGNICHTGLVYKVAEGYVFTIEGNTSSADGMVANGGRVNAKKYSLTYTHIAGYGRPKYDDSPLSEDAEEVAKEAEWHSLVVDLQKALNAECDADLVVDGKAGRKTFQATPTLSVRTRDKKPKTVKALQSLLSYWGYKCLVDGDFYNATEKQVRSFQEEKVSMPNPDGELWARKETWKVLLNLQ